MSQNKIRIPVVGGMMTLQFGGVCSTGNDPDTRPGIGFEIESESQLFQKRGQPGFYGGMGVISRTNARLLAAELIAMANVGDASVGDHD